MPKQPIDAIKTFVTAEDLIERRLTLDEFNAAISSASRAALLKALAGILARIETTSTFNQDVQRDVANQYFQGAGLNRALTAIDAGRILLAPQTLLVAMKTVLVLAPEDGPNDVSAGALFTVLLFLADVVGGAEGKPEDRWRGFPREVSLEVIRNQNFNRSEVMSVTMARYWRLWHELPLELGAGNPPEEFAEEAGCRPEELMLFGLWCWVSAQRGLIHLPSQWLADIPLPDKAKAACVAIMTAPIGELRERAGKESVEDGIPWAFLAFRQSPLTTLSDGSLVILSPRYVAERAFGGAMYWTLNDRANRIDGEEVRNGPAWQAFRNRHASCVEKYAEEVLAGWLPAEDDRRRAYFEEDMEVAWGEGTPVSDVALDYDWAWACLEINSRRFSQGAAMGAGPEEMDRELRLMVEDKAGRQLHSTVNKLRSAARELTQRDSRARRFFPVMLLAYGFPANPLTIETIREKLRGSGQLQGEDVAQLELIDLQELDMLDAVREQTGETFVRVLRDKQDSAFFRSSISDYLYLEKQLDIPASARLDALFRESFGAALAASNDPSLIEGLEQRRGR